MRLDNAMDKSCMEVLKLGTNPLNPDTDSDGLLDGYTTTTDPYSSASKDFVDVSLYSNLVNVDGKYVGELSMNTNPLVYDTDGDGVGDGAEVQNLSYLGISEAEWGAILHSKDYDNDNIPDGYEIRAFYYYYRFTDKSELGGFLNVSNSSDALADFDSDGLTNLEEYQRNPSGDSDGDGIPDIYDTDDDNDGIPTSVELQNHLDPFNSADAEADLDNDGLTNIFEYQHNLSITDKDTDHDGINDGEELNYWNETRGIDLETSLSYCRIPDVDNDSIPDGKEINGYEVKIIVDWKDDGTPISRMRYIEPNELDPLTPYANETGVYTDSDEDGIPDIAESMLSNRSKWSEFQTNYPDLWSEYSWIQSYFWTVVDKDYDEHGNWTSAIENATQWLKDQFNPLIRDRTPPMITKFTLRWEVEFSVSLEPVKVYAHLHLVVRDVGGIYYLYILDEDSGESITYTDAGSMLDINHKFKASILTATFGSVKISIVAEDYAHNVLSAEKELKGALKKVLDGLKALWNAIWNTLCKVAEAMAKAVNVILEWIIGQIKGLLQAPMETLSSLLNSLSMTMLSAYEKYAPSESRGDGQESDKISPSDAKRLLEESGLTNLLKIIGITVGILYVAMTMIMLLTAGIGGIILWTVMSVIIYLIIQAIVGTFKEGELGVVGEILNTMVSAAISTITEMIKVTVGVIKAMCDYLGAPYRPTLTGYWLSALSFFAGGLGFILGAGKIAAGLVGTIFSVMSIVLSGVLMVILTKMANPQFQVSRAAVYGIGLTAIFCGIIGAIYGAKAVFDKKLNEKLWGVISLGLTAVSLIVSGVSLFV